MTVTAAFAVLGIALAWCVWRIGDLSRRARSLARERDEKHEALTRTSKLLIDKNIELFDQNVRQQKQLESKEDFIGIISHQLRTPATEVRWGLDALASELAKHAEGRELEYFNKLKKSAERMVRLIDNLVRLMTLDEQYGRVSITPYEPDAVVKETAEDVARKFADKRIHLELALSGPPSLACINKDALELVVENLVENAYQYTHEDGRITVATKANPDGRFICAISDTGVGIPAAKLRTVFVKFQRSEVAMRMNSGGMGLGLYLVKSIIERSGGAVSFTSEEGKGSSFTFTLPCKRATF